MKFVTHTGFTLQAVRFYTSALVIALGVLCGAMPADANHGPGTSGGGTAVVSGQTLKKGRTWVAFNLGYTDYENISRAQAEARAATAGGFDAIRDAILTTVSIAYGLTDNLQLGAALGYYDGRNFIDAERDPADGSVESGVADPSGLSDLSVTAKYRLLEGNPAHVSLLFGVTIPTGKDDERLDNGEVLEASSQPGTGAFAYSGGVAASMFLAAHTTLNTSLMFTYRDTDGGFRVGNKLNAGVSVAHRFLHSHRHGRHGQGSHSLHILGLQGFEAFLEASMVSVGHDEIGGVENPNSGGTTVFLAPGVRVRFSQMVEFVLSPAWPIFQHLSGEQADTDFKSRAELSLFF